MKKYFVKSAEYKQCFIRAIVLERDQRKNWMLIENKSMWQTAYVRVIESDNSLDFPKPNSHFIKMKIQQFFVKQMCLELPKFTGWHTPTKFLMTESLKRDLLDLDLQYLPTSSRSSQEMYFWFC